MYFLQMSECRLRFFHVFRAITKTGHMNRYVYKCLIIIIIIIIVFLYYHTVIDSEALAAGQISVQ